MKTVLITGASSGIGRAVALRFAKMGYRVYAGGRDRQRLHQLCEQCRNITPLVCDLTSKDDIEQASTQIPELDLLMLNAGHCEYIDDAINFDGELFARVINTNLISVGYCLQAWLKKIKPQGQLAITSSSASFLPFPRAQAYGASKAALTYLAQSLSLDLAKHGIGVSIIHPGFVQTSLTDKNTFDMPSIISSERAAQYIVDGLIRRQPEINFPKRLIWTLKFIAMLPFSWWRTIALRYVVKN